MSVRVLLAERDEGLAIWLEGELQKMRFAVERVSSGVQAEERLAAQAFDAALLGWNLPGKSGCDILVGLRAAGNAVPVLIIADTDTLAERVASFNSGADDFLPRLVPAEELAARLNAVMRRSLIRTDNCFRCGALVYGSDTRLFHLDGVHLAVTPREHAILVALIEKPGCTVTRSTIMRRMDSIGAYQGCQSGIEIMVHRLRKKLGSDFVTIETVREAGYRLAEIRNKNSE